MSALFTVPSGDYVSHMFSMLFGTAWSTVQSLGLGAASSSTATQNYLGKMFLVYNTAILAVITIYITKILFEGAIGTAQKGEWFGKMYSTFWMPARMVLMLGMLAPVLGGYCFGQVAVLFAVNTGIGVADDLANTGINAVIRTGVVSPPANVPSQRSTVDNLFRIETCMAAYNYDPFAANAGSSTAPAVAMTTTNNGQVEDFGGDGTNGIPADACGSIDLAGLNSAQLSALSTLEGTIKAMDNQGGPIYNIIQTVYNSQGTGSNNIANDSTGGTAMFNSSQDNELTQAASTFEASLYSVVKPNDTSLTSEWTNDVNKYGFAELGTLMLNISTYDGSLNAVVGQGPLVTPPESPQTTSTSNLSNALKDANTYINNHNSAPITSPATSSGDGNALTDIQLPQEPGVSGWALSPLSTFKAQADYEIVKHIVNPTLNSINSVTDVTANPLGVIQGFGQGMLDVGTAGGLAIMGIEATADGGLAAAGGKFLGNGVNSTPFAMLVASLGAILMGLVAPFFFFGMLCAYIIPMMPYTVMVMTIIGYVGAVAVAMVGAPLWIAAHAVPTGEGFVNEASKSGYRLLLSLFAKPALIVFGFFMSLAMFSAGVYLINQTFFSAMQSVLGTALGTGTTVAEPIGGVIAMGVMFGFNAIVVLVFGLLAMIFILVSLYLALAKWSFGLMNLIPDNALTWVGMQDISMGEERIADEALIGQAYMGARGAGKGAQDGIGAGLKKSSSDRDELKREKTNTANAKMEETRHNEMVAALRGDAGADAQAVSNSGREGE